MKEIQIFKSVLEYSIDNSPERDKLFRLLNLDVDSFYNEIYLERSKAEKRIRELLNNPGEVLLISGDKGCGKTSISNKVLKDIGNEYFILKIDFKSDSFLDKELFKVKINSKSEKERREISTKRIEQYLLKKIKIKFSNLKIRDFHVGIYSFINEEPGENNIDEFRAIENLIIDPFKPDEYDNLNNEQKSILIKSLVRSEPVIWNAYINKLSLKDYLTYIIESLGYRQVFCLFDNVDSFDSLKDQENLIHFANKTQVELKEYLKIILTIRILNPSIKYIFSDYDTYLNKNVILDYFEFLDDQSYEYLGIKKGRKYTKREQTLILSYLSERHQQFTLDIISMRMELILKNFSKLKEFYGSSKIKFDNILSSCENILNNHRIKNSLTNLCNCDRRLTLKKLVEFLEYLDLNGNLPLTNNFNLESAFNRWLISKSEILDFDNLNFTHNFSLYQNNDILLNHLALNFISNSTDNESIYYGYEQRLEVKAIVDNTVKLGLSSDRVRNAILRLLTNDNVPTGLLECENFNLVNENSILPDNLSVWLTPRARTLKSYSIFTFNFLLALLIENKYIIDGIQIDSNLDSKSNLAFFYVTHFLANFGQNHIRTMSEIIPRMDSHYPKLNFPETRKKYIDQFGMCTAEEDVNSNRFLFQNLLVSHVKFISGVNGKEFRKKHWIGVYKQIQSLFKEDLQRIESGDQILEISYVDKLSLI